MLKLAYFLKNLQNSWANNSRILMIKNAKFSGYCLYMNIKLYGNFNLIFNWFEHNILKANASKYHFFITLSTHFDKH